MRKRIYEIIDEAFENDLWSKLYDIFMIVAIIVSLVPLAFKDYNSTFKIIDCVTASIFIADYVLRLVTADFKFGRKSASSFLLYPFTPMAVIDLLAILPTLSPLSSTFKLLKLLKLLKFARVIKALNFLQHSKYVGIIENVFKHQKQPLTIVITMAVLYILASALIVFNVEPDSFKTFLDAVYFATMSITNFGYCETSLVTPVGKVMAMISSVFGIVIVALPAAILTAGYLNELKKASLETE